MPYGFQITNFKTQQLSIVLMTALLEHFNLDVNEKVTIQSYIETYKRITTSLVYMCIRECEGHYHIRELMTVVGVEVITI